MEVLEFLAAFEPRSALAVILAAAIVLYAVSANLAWLSHTPRGGRLGRLLGWGQHSRVASFAGELARWLYYLGVPWGTLMLGYNTMRALGVWGMDWFAPAPVFLALTLGAAAAIFWVWRPYVQVEHLHAIDESGWNWARHMVEIVYQEAHWAFYRSGPILWLGDNAYWGSLFGLMLVLLEGVSNPQVRAHWRDVTRADAPLWSGSLAIISTLIFIYTQNAWYCLLVHLVLDQGLRGLIGFPRAHAGHLLRD